MKKNIRIFLYAFAVLLAFSGCSKKEESYVISGKVDPSLNMKKVYLYGRSNKPLDSAEIKNNQFEFKGKTDRVKDMALGSADGKVFQDIILENQKYDVDFQKNFIKVHTKGIHDKIFGFRNDEKYYNLSLEGMKAYEKIFSNIDENDEKQVNEAFGKFDKDFGDKLRKIETDRLQSIMQSNESSLVKSFALMKIQDGENYAPEKLIGLLQGYQKENKNPDVEEFIKSLKFMKDSEMMEKTVAAGNTYKEVVSVDANGKSVKLSDIVKNNKYTILEFWASWCGPCRGEIPNLKKAYSKYKGKGLEIVSVSLDDKSDKWHKALTEEGTQWINTNAPDNFKDSYVMSYGVSGIPASYLINQKGEIVAHDMELRGNKLEETLSKYLK